MTIRALTSLLLVAVVGAFCASAEASAQEVGLIEQIRGNTYWKADSSAQPVRLNPRRDRGRLLRAGEQLRCDRGGQLRLRLYDRAVIWVSSSWFPIPYTARDQSEAKRQVLVTYGSRGGGDRGTANIYSPANGSTVKPGALDIRWIPKRGFRPITLLIKEASPSGREILRQAVPPGVTDHLNTKDAQDALLRYRAEHGHGPLRLILLGPRQENMTITLYLLTVGDERSLSRELRSWDQESKGLWRHLGRAHAFIARGMFSEAAKEYDAALAYAPESIDLLRRAVAAHRRTGNEVRVRKLSRRLQKGTER